MSAASSPTRPLASSVAAPAPALGPAPAPAPAEEEKKMKRKTTTNKKKKATKKRQPAAAAGGGDGGGAGKRKTYKQLVQAALLEPGNRNGFSRVAIEKYIVENGQGDNVAPGQMRAFVSRTLKRAVEDGSIVQTKQSFRLAPSTRRKIQTTTTTKAATAGKKMKKKTRPSLSQRKKAAGSVTVTVIKKKTTKKAAAAAPAQASRPLVRPIKKWIGSVLAGEKRGIKVEKLLETLIQKHRILVRDRAAFTKSVKAAISRGVASSSFRHMVNGAVALS